MKFENEINKIKQHKKVYFAFAPWDCFARRLGEYTYSLCDSDTAIDRIIDRLPSICSIDIFESDDYPYPQVRANL